MAISLSFGRNLPTDRKDTCYEAEREFMKRFCIKFGELNCLKLTGVHLGTPEGQAAFKDKDQIRLCTDYVGEAVRIVFDVVEEKKFQGEVQDKPR